MARQPSQEIIFVTAQSKDEALERVCEQYDEGSKYQKKVIIEHLISVSDKNVLNTSNPHGSGSLSGYAQRNLSPFEVLEASVRPQR